MAISPRLLFLSFLGFGLITGLFLGNLGQAIAAPAERENQHNVLFVLVDDLTAEHPTLEGIWLAAQSEIDGVWNWMPIYPEPLAEEASDLAKPHTAFYLPDASFDDVAALPPLRGQSAWWDEVFWLDKNALSRITVSGVDPSLAAETWQEPQKSLFEQVQLINKLCASPQASLDEIVGLMPTHIRSTSSPFELIRRWDAWTAGGSQLSCAHPWAN